MFESIVISPRATLDPNVEKGPIDLGVLAESMLFYGSVNVIVNDSVLRQLVQQMGIEVLIEYVERGYLKIKYLENGMGIRTGNTGTPLERHTPVIYQLPHLRFEAYSTELFRELIGKSGKGRRLAHRFQKYVEPISLPTHIVNDVLTDFSDSKLVEESATYLVKQYVPELTGLGDATFKVIRGDEGLSVQSNINFQAVNAIYHRRVSPKHTSIAPGLLLSHIANLQTFLYFSSKFNSEIAVDSINSNLLKLKCADIVQKSNASQTAVHAFQDFLFEDAKSLGESIRNGSRSFADLLQVLDKAERFKDWIKGKPPNIDLVKEYFRAVTSESWIEKLPSKGLRWAIFTASGIGLDLLGAGVIGTAIAVALSVVDSFILDNILKGWKPNQFVDGPLQKFIAKT
jgi:hypothetical protein